MFSVLLSCRHYFFIFFARTLRSALALGNVIHTVNVKGLMCLWCLGPCLFILGASADHLLTSIPAFNLFFLSNLIGVAGWLSWYSVWLHIPRPELESRLEHKNKPLMSVFRVKNMLLLTRCQCAPTPVCRYISTHKNDHVRTLNIL